MSKGNIAVVAAILLILYLMVGHSFVMFFLGGKEQMLKVAREFARQCQTLGHCPTAPKGWREAGKGMWRQNELLYLPDEPGGDTEAGSQGFRLVYSFPLPDDWYEVRGGVGQPLTSGWASR